MACDFTHAWFRRERLMIAARCCGAMARLIEEARNFAESRVVSGEPIANYQLIQAMLADSVTDLHAARLMTYEAAAAHDRGDDLKSLHARCSLAKLFASRGGLPRRRPGRPDFWRPRLHAGKRRRALLAGSQGRPHLGRHQRNPAADHCPVTLETRA